MAQPTIIRMHHSAGIYTIMTAYWDCRHGQSYSVQQYSLRGESGSTSMERESIWSTYNMADEAYDQYMQEEL